MAKCVAFSDPFEMCELPATTCTAESRPVYPQRDHGTNRRRSIDHPQLLRELQMAASVPNSDTPRAPLGMWDAVSLIVGVIIGASIFRSPADIYGNITDIQFVPAWVVAMGLWVLAGILSFVGALCYAELATTYPSSGGDYVFI